MPQRGSPDLRRRGRGHRRDRPDHRRRALARGRQRRCAHDPGDRARVRRERGDRRVPDGRARPARGGGRRSRSSASRASGRPRPPQARAACAGGFWTSWRCSTKRRCARGEDRMTRRFDPTLYLVTDPELARGRRLADVVGAAVRGGVTLVSCATSMPAGGLARDRARAQVGARPARRALLVNDRVDVAHAAGAGCHVGRATAGGGGARSSGRTPFSACRWMTPSRPVRSTRRRSTTSPTGRSRPPRPRRMRAVRSGLQGWPRRAS